MYCWINDNPLCREGWLQDVKDTVERELATANGEEGEGHRVEPMALVRCSREGKTRALYEISNRAGHTMEILLLSSSFRSTTSPRLTNAIKKNHALLRRIAFAALKTRYDGKPSVRFSEFRERDFAITKADILHWLGDAPALLIMDELKNLDELTLEGSRKATEFAEFVKATFLTPTGRYFVFSTRIFSTLKCFRVLLDPSRSSERAVVLQELPLADNLSTARGLNNSLWGSREAIYYGLMPRLMIERRHLMTLLQLRGCSQ
jgi:hypothetical protein